MHIGHKFPTEYYMEEDAGGKVKIEETTMEKDLGIHTTSDLKSSVSGQQESQVSLSYG